MTFRRSLLALLVLVSFMGNAAAQGTGVPAQPGTQVKPTPIPSDIKIVEQIGEQVPTDLPFVDEAGVKRTLSDYLDGTQPVILVPVYYSCPLLCNITLNRLVGTLQALPWTPGNGFRIVTFTIDARETPELARNKKKTYMKELARPGAEQGWHFLTSPGASIRTLTDAVGFGYRYDRDRMEYLHHAALIILSPDGRVHRYMRGSYTPPLQLKLALLRAGQGQFGTFKERAWAQLFTYVDEERRYVFDSRMIGIVLALMASVFIGLSVLALRVRRRNEGA